MPIFTSCIKSYDSSAFHVSRRLIFLLCLSIFAGAQQPPAPVDDSPDAPSLRTPKQLAELLKSNHKKNLEDLERMAKLVEEVQVDERKNAEYAVSLQSLKRLEQIEKLSKVIRERMKLY